jgi:hypothetical protein
VLTLQSKTLPSKPTLPFKHHKHLWCLRGAYFAKQNSSLLCKAKLFLCKAKPFLLSTIGAYSVVFLSMLAYLCHPFYLCLLISKHKATEGYANACL